VIPVIFVLNEKEIPKERRILDFEVILGRSFSNPYQGMVFWIVIDYLWNRRGQRQSSSEA
jgi:hypothetical protein